MYKFCPICSESLVDRTIENEGIIPYCIKCDKLYFPFSNPCVICLVKYENKYVLIKQSYVSNNYILVAGHIKKCSTAESTVKEEIYEELGLEVTNVKYINSYYHQKQNNLMFGYYVETKGNININNVEVDSYILVEQEEAIELLKNSSIALQLLKDIIILNNK